MSTLRLVALLGTLYLFFVPLRLVSQSSPDSLIASWEFNSPWGQMAFDESGNNHHGTLNSGASFDPDGGVNDGAVQLDGTNGRVNVPAFDVIGDQITISARIFLDSIDRSPGRNDEGRIISKASSTNESDHYWMLGLASGTRLRFRLSTGGSTRSYETSSGLIEANRWIHVAAVYDGSEVRMYVDSTLVHSAAASGIIGTDPNTDVSIGNQPEGAGQRALAGRIDYLQVFDRALPIDPGSQEPGSLISYWPLDETAGPTAFDDEGNNDGDLNGGVTMVPGGGFLNGAAQFDGDTGRITLPPIEISGNEISITAQIYVDDLSSTNNRDEGRILSKANGTARQSHFWMLSLNEVGRLRFRLKTADQHVELESADNVLVAEEWTQVGAVYDGSEVRLYVNGIQVASTSASGLILPGTGVAAAIGNQPAGAGDRPFAGRIDELRLYDRAISEGELFGPSNNFALPVSWVSFGGQPTAAGVNLKWEVADQRDNAGFYVERAAADLGVFETIGFVAATVEDHYSYVDATARENNWLYRLRQVDHDGASDYSRTVAVRSTVAATLTVYPNPARDVIHSERSGAYRIFGGDGRELDRGDYRAGEPLSVANLTVQSVYYLSIGGETTPFRTR